MKTKTAVGLIVGGALAGAGLALLFAPAPGTDTRKKAASWLDQLLAKVKTALEKGKSEAEHKTEQLSAAYKAGKQAYHESNLENGREKTAA
jgi:gas vesicle protein